MHLQWKNDTKGREYIFLSLVFYIKWGSRFCSSLFPWIVHSPLPSSSLHHQLGILLLWELERNTIPDDSDSLGTAEAMVWRGVWWPRNAGISSKLGDGALLGLSLHLSEPVTAILFLKASSPLVSRKKKLTWNYISFYRKYDLGL